MVGEQGFRERQEEVEKKKRDLEVLFKTHQLPERKGKYWNKPHPSQSLHNDSGWEEVFYTNFCSLRQPEECSLVMPHFHGKSTCYCSLFPDRLAWGAKGQLRTRNRIVPTHFLSSLGPCPPGIKKTGENVLWLEMKRKGENGNSSHTSLQTAHLPLEFGISCLTSPKGPKV